MDKRNNPEHVQNRPVMCFANTQAYIRQLAGNGNKVQAVLQVNQRH
jgi:hypothetical protein